MIHTINYVSQFGDRLNDSGNTVYIINCVRMLAQQKGDTFIWLIRTLNFMSASSQVSYDFRGINIIYIYKFGVKLVVKSSVFYRGADVLAPIQVEDSLKYGWENSRSSRATNGKIEIARFILNNCRSCRWKWSLGWLRVVNYDTFISEEADKAIRLLTWRWP